MRYRRRKGRPSFHEHENGEGRKGPLPAYRILMEHTIWTILEHTLLDDITKSEIIMFLQIFYFFIGNELLEFWGGKNGNPSVNFKGPLQPNEATNQNFPR